MGPPGTSLMWCSLHEVEARRVAREGRLSRPVGVRRRPSRREAPARATPDRAASPPSPRRTAAGEGPVFDRALAPVAERRGVGLGEQPERDRFGELVLVLPRPRRPVERDQDVEQRGRPCRTRSGSARAASGGSRTSRAAGPSGSKQQDRVRRVGPREREDAEVARARGARDATAGRGSGARTPRRRSRRRSTTSPGTNSVVCTGRSRTTVAGRPRRPARPRSRGSRSRRPAATCADLTPALTACSLVRDGRATRPTMRR